MGFPGFDGENMGKPWGVPLDMLIFRVLWGILNVEQLGKHTKMVGVGETSRFQMLIVI
jgi:hypothetical protein